MGCWIWYHFCCLESSVQFTVFWATTFWTEVAHLAMYSIFNSCQYGGLRKKKTMLAFNADEFLAVSAMCPGQSIADISTPVGDWTQPMGSRHLMRQPIQWDLRVWLQLFLLVCCSAVVSPLWQIHWNRCSHALCRPCRRLEHPLDSRQDHAEFHHWYVHTNNVSKFKDPSPVCQDFKIWKEQKMMFCWYKNPNNGCPKGPDSLLLNTFPFRSRGDQTSRKLESHAMPQMVWMIATLEILTIMPQWILTNLEIMLQWLFQANFCRHWIWERRTPTPRRIGSFRFGGLLGLQTNLWTCQSKQATRPNFIPSCHRSLWTALASHWCSPALEPGVAEVLQGKRILVWKEMLQSINYSDMGVVDEFCAGSKLTGQTDLTNLWPSKVTPATMTEGELHSQAKLQRDGLSYRQVVFFDSEIAHSVWDQALQEVTPGEAEGPFDLNEVPWHFPLSRRFGVKQSGKIRCVDDFSWSGINAASQPRESPKPHTLDVVAAMISAVMCHAEGGHAWLARSFDLKSAYRQCAVHPESRQFSYIVVGDLITLSLKVFRLKALPCGSVKSVHSFLRISHSLWAILTSIFWVITTNYFDDFVSIAESREAAVKAVFRLLGWRFAEDGPQAPPFCSSLVALGVELDVSQLHNGTVHVANTESRRIELAQSLDQAIGSRSLTKLEALRLRGRMQFASGQFYGRLARRCLAVVTQHAYSSESSMISEAAAHALSRFRDMLVNGVPRMISSKSSATCFLFTDASHEPHAAVPFSGVGGVLVDQLGCRRRFFLRRCCRRSMFPNNNFRVWIFLCALCNDCLERFSTSMQCCDPYWQWCCERRFHRLPH